MASFDIIRAASAAYKTSWGARQYLMRLVAVPMLVKLVFFTLAIAYAGGEENSDPILFTLILVPAYLAEGWMLAHWVRYLVLRQTWPYVASGDLDRDMQVLSVRARGVLSGMIIYVLIHMAIGLYMAFVGTYFGPYMPEDPNAGPVEVPGHVAMLSLMLLVFSFWGFRLMWLYIPYAINLDGREYLRNLRGFGTSLHMIAGWLLGVIPFVAALQVFSSILTSPQAAGEGSLPIVMIALGVVADTIKSLVSTAVLTFGIQEMYARTEKMRRS